MNIKTKSDFWEMAESQYQRTSRLVEFVNNPNADADKRERASKLLEIMKQRMAIIYSIAVKIIQPVRPPDFPIGGFINKKSDLN